MLALICSQALPSRESLIFVKLLSVRRKVHETVRGTVFSVSSQPLGRLAPDDKLC